MQTPHRGMTMPTSRGILLHSFGSSATKHQLISSDNAELQEHHLAKGMAGLGLVARCMLFAAAMVAASDDPLAEWIDSLKFKLDDVAWPQGLWLMIES